MNIYQRFWFDQTRSDHEILQLLRRHRVRPCHQLHYLQMITEKLGKAYFWRTGRPPRMSHASLVRFLQALENRSTDERTRIAHLFGFGRAHDFGNWMPTIMPLAHALERLAPDLAGYDGPNAEYPWPHDEPRFAPVSFEFDIWRHLTESARGRQLIHVIDRAVLEFPKYA
jgi:hypothetical protein